IRLRCLRRAVLSVRYGRQSNDPMSGTGPEHSSDSLRTTRPAGALRRRGDTKALRHKGTKRAGAYLPSLLQTAIEPIPEHVEHQLRRPANRVVDRCANPDACQNVLALT